MNDKKSILFVVPELCVGGVSRSLLGMLRRIPYDQYDVTLMLFSKENKLLSELPTQVHIQYSSTMGQIETIRKRFSKMLQHGPLTPLFRFCKKAYHVIGGTFTGGEATYDSSYDVAISYQDGICTWYVAEHISASRKIAFVHTDFEKAGYNSGHEKRAYDRFDQVCFGSKASMHSFLKCMPEYEGKTALVPNVIDVDKIITMSNEGPGFSDGFKGIRILTVGRLSHEKGSYKIARIIDKLRGLGAPFKWYLIGDGPLKERLCQEAKKRRELVLLGTKENPYPFIRQCDLYVQPSDYEGYCIALAESRLFSKLAVVCDFSGAREQIGCDTSGIITGFTVDELYEGIKIALLSLAEHPNNSARAMVKNSFSYELIDAWINSL